MKTLYIVRHAKSSWNYKKIEDYDRPLKQRGIIDAHLISKHVATVIKKPDVFLSSSAQRALHTAIIFSENFGYPLSNLHLSKELYNFNDSYLVKIVRALDDGFDSAMVFSHDHGINNFVNTFGNKPIAHVPTSSVIGMQFDVENWKDVKKGETILVESPKFHR